MTVTVVTNEPAVRTYELVVEVVIREFVVVTPQALQWALGSEPAGRLLQVSLVAGFGFRGAESASPDFSVEEVGRADGAVQLRVTPRDTWARRNGLIKVKVAQEGKLPADVLVPVKVQ